MPSKSENQQQLMAMALMYKRGKMKDASATVKAVAKNMSEKELEKYAATPTKGLPKKLKKEDIMQIFEKFIVKVGDDFRIKSAKTGKLWPQKYDSYKNALGALKAYQVHKNETIEDNSKSTLSQIQAIVNTKSSGKVDKEMVDVATANLLLGIYDALPTPKLRNKFLKLPIKKMVHVANKLI
jgi:hypothetical protein